MTDKLEKLFNEIFNNRKLIPLIPNKNMMKRYTACINSINKYTLDVKANSSLSYLLKDIPNVDKVRLNDLQTDYKYFILNSFRFGILENQDNKNKQYRKISRWLGLTNLYNGNFYGERTFYDVRISMLADEVIRNSNMYHDIAYHITDNVFYIENVYYINRLDNKSPWYFYDREEFLKNMKVSDCMTKSQVNKFNEFVNSEKFVNLMCIMKKIVNKFYITGSVIDYINNTTFNKENYIDSDIDIVVTDKIKFQLLSGYLLKYVEDLDSDIVEYTGRYINIKPGVFSHRHIQIYYMKEKYCVFAHHFPCVRGYINSKLKMSLSHQAIDIFRPDSDKKIKYIFMFPYTDLKKCKQIITKYRARGYIIS